MKSRWAACPACAAPVEFRVSASLVAVCEFCHSVVARGDKDVADHGKVADLVQTDSPLKVGASGKYRKHRFEVVGHVQYQHPAGGVWDEWYLAFTTGRWGWLAEAQGKFYLTFERRTSESTKLPAFDELEVGKRFRVRKDALLTVAEMGVAQTGAAEGEIPWAFRPGVPHRFADLHSDEKTFATFDYSTGGAPRLFLGEEVTLGELQITGGALGAGGPPPPPSVKALQVNCPQCAGALTLHAPDKSERVTCPNCAALLDCNRGKLEYLKTLHLRELRPIIPIGAVGTLRGTEYTVIGVMQRAARTQWGTFAWSEYLLYNAGGGFRWLLCNEGHWSFVEPVSVHQAQYGHSEASYQGKKFRIFDRGTALVRHVLGEFYWRVEVGDEVRTADFIAPPQSLSFEWSGEEDSKELNVSLGSYVRPEEIEQAFGLSNIRRPFGVGPLQPRPDNSAVFWLWPLVAGILLLIDITTPVVRGIKVDQWMFIYALAFASIIPAGLLLYNYNFEVQRWKDSDYSPYASDD